MHWIVMHTNSIIQFNKFADISTDFIENTKVSFYNNSKKKIVEKKSFIAHKFSKNWNHEQ